MFSGRQEELRKLNAIYNSGRFECVVVHGRRRSGKTALLREFMANKRAVYFAARETGARENACDFVRCVEALAGRQAEENERQPASSGADGFGGALALVGEMASKERAALIIDDYQFLTASHRGISALICEQISNHLKNSRLMLVVCGSCEPVMEKETLGYDSPFHGSRTAQIKLLPFTFFETRKLCKGFSQFDSAVIYGLTGGVPKYLEQMDPELSIEDNILKNFFDPASFMFEEPANILRREVREPTYYNAILRAIADGRIKNSEIASAVGLETSACTAYLNNLIALGFVGKHTPAAEKSGKKTIYEIEDNMFRFWYRFVFGNISMIQSGMTPRIWRSVAQGIPDFMSKVFEDICRQWLHQRNKAERLPVKFVEQGRWWGADPVWKTDTAVPIVAYADDEHAIFGDCVWSEDPAPLSAITSLAERSRLFRYTHRYLYLFSRSGFSKECSEMAARIGANLVMFE